MSLVPSPPTQKRSRKNRKAGATHQSHTVTTISLGVASLPMFVPENWTRKHKYVENFIITGGAAGVFGSTYAYALNGMYDPYLGAGGHQPYGFDELSPWFNSYCVTSCEVAVTAVAPNSGSVVLGISWRPSAGSFNPAGLGISDFAEKDNSRWVYVPVTPARFGDNTVALQPFDIAKLEGKTRSQILTENEFQGTPAGNPASVPQLFFNTADAAGTSGSTCALIVELTYTAIWRGRKTFGQS